MDLYLEQKNSDAVKQIAQVSQDTSEDTVVKKEVKVPVDFDELKKVNSDIYAWIKIPGTKIDYPILQSAKGEDRSFYLTHNVNKERSSYGAIYTQNYNNKDFEDYNTLIYGHNMFNGSMFGTLKKYRDRTFFDKYQEIKVYMPGRILKYKIFAAYVFDSRHIMLSFDFDDAEDRQLYLETIFSNRSMGANFNDDVTVTSDDKIITLSTCTSNDDERYLVQGVLIYDSDRDS